ncbi:MAG: SIS domain-containing protein [Deltaproteobacteria bacterium]|nr:SIS domain-containing protein [Deltaproteobacteria bacterium]
MAGEAMAREIREQPGMLRARAEGWEGEALRLRRGALAGRGTLVVLGRGSSGNAATFATYLWALRTGRHPVEFRPWLATQPLPAADWSDAAVLAFSASGRSTDVAQAAAWLRGRGARVVAVTESADVETHVARAAHDVLALEAGPERAAPATKSFCAQLFAAAALCGYPIRKAALQTADAMDMVLAADLAEPVARFLAGARTVSWVSRGFSIAGALDAALKFQQTTDLPSFAHSTAEFLHGPIGGCDDRDRVVLFSEIDEPLASKRAVEATLLARRVPLLALGVDHSEEAALPLPLPDDRWARTAMLAFVSQLTCLEVAVTHGLDPDTPAGLRRVTPPP